MKIYATAPDTETVRSHYKAMVEGRLPASDDPRNGYGRLGRVFRRRGYTGTSGGGSSPRNPTVQLVTPAAMAAEQARAQLGRRKTVGKKRKRVTAKRGGKPAKRKTRSKAKPRRGGGEPGKRGRGKAARGGRKKGTSSRGTKKRKQSGVGRRRDNFS